MRFVRLAVEAFRAIERAEIEFGPGLNILHGPNDLGKSTLAAAIRAALLVPPMSSEGAQFTSWFSDATPRVELTFADADDRYWTVRKGFGDGSTKGVELLHSKDGVSFTLDCKGREVEERLRTMLAWGIPAPGGKGAPRGVPSTFLANALLAAQTDVDRILEASLATDPDPNGKLRLSKALATLAQDPLFKTVLDQAQREVDMSFTRTGQRSRSQTSRFTVTGDAIKALEKEREDQRRRVADSATIEEQVGALRQRRDHASLQVATATAGLSAIRDRLTRTRARQEVSARLESAKAALSEIDAQAEHVRALAVDLERLGQDVKACEEAMSRAAGEVEATAAAVREAQERLRMATSEDGARERELLRARLAEQSAVLVAERQTAEQRKGTVFAAIKAVADAKLAREASAKARGELGAVQARLEAGHKSAAAIETELELARATVAYGRWRAAKAAADDAARAKDISAKAGTEAAQKSGEAASLDQMASSLEADLAARQALLPTHEQLTALLQLQRELEIAEAALGGGVSVVVRPRTAVSVRARIDDKEAVDAAELTLGRALEAERSVHLSVADLVDIEVTVGAAEKRRVVETLRRRRQGEVAPALRRAQLTSLNEVGNAVSAVAKERAGMEELRRRAMNLRGDADKLLERAGEQAAQATTLSSSAEALDDRKAAIGETAQAVLEKRWAALGSAWETSAEVLHSKKVNERRTAEGEVRAAEQAVTLAEYRVSEADRMALEAGANGEAATALAGSSAPETLLLSIERDLASLIQHETAIAAKLMALAAASSDEVHKAEKAVEATEQRFAAAKSGHARAAAAIEAMRAALNARAGEVGVLRGQLVGMDRAAAGSLLEQRIRELADLPVEKDATEANLREGEQDVGNAARDLEAAKEDLHKSEGALSKVGGSAAREEVDRIEEALAAERARERELEVDADAWMLLRDTLREVENEEGAHLGRALSGPVSKKFEELTAGRYKDLRFDAALKTEALSLGGAPGAGSEVLSALSVGTRNQLATLIRLTLAAQLQTTIVLDDHLVHTDPLRLAWFRETLMKTAVSTQVIILTCRPEDYLPKEGLPTKSPERGSSAGAVRAIDVAYAMKRWTESPSRRPSSTTVERADPNDER
jgi:hypothetical protein